MSHLKLQKLLYFSQAAHLALYGKRLFKDKIEAWKLGPVVPAVYQSFKDLKNRPITKPNNQAYLDNLDQDSIDFLEQIWDIYGKFSANKLVRITHAHKPWQQAYNESVDYEIKPKVLREYYKGIFTFVD